MAMSSIPTMPFRRKGEISEEPFRQRSAGEV